MNTTFLLSPARALALAVLLASGAASSVRATTYTWDPNANRSDAAGSGGWNTTAGNTVWDNGTADVVWPNTNSLSDTAIFGGADGSYTVTVANGITASNLYFTASGYTLVGASAASPGTLTVGSTGGQQGVAAGKTLTIGANMTMTTSSYWNIYGTYVGGTVNVVNGGVFTPGGQFASGQFAGGIAVGAAGTVGSTSATYTMSSGTIAINGAGAQFLTRGIAMTNSTVTLTQGTFNTGGGMGTSLSNSTLNLNGGTFIAGFFSSSTANSTINFNGSTVQNTIYGGFAAGSGQAGKFIVQIGGAKFDTAYVMTLSPVLQHDATGPAIDGGLVKSSSGTLTLSAANTYNGGTTVSGGTLAISANGGLGTGDASAIATSVSLSIGTGVTNPFNNTFGHLTLTGGGVVGTDDNGYLDLTSGANIVVGSLTLGGVTYTSGVFSHANAAEYIAGTGTVTVVPEPGSLALTSLLAAGLGTVVRRRHRRTEG